MDTNQTNKSVLITQSNYIPWKGYFDAINRSDEFIIFDEVQYTRRDWRNRNHIKTPNGLIWLSIPVDTKGKYFQTINQTQVCDHSWREKHWKTIQNYYSNAPYFFDYAEQFQQCFLANFEYSLSKINESFIRTVNDILNITTKITRCEDYGLVEGQTERLVDLCLKTNASNYISGPAAKSYLNIDLFSKAEISVHWMDYSNYPVYTQMFGSFKHNVSILDLIFNTGPDAKKYIVTTN